MATNQGRDYTDNATAPLPKFRPTECEEPQQHLLTVVFTKPGCTVPTSSGFKPQMYVCDDDYKQDFIQSLSRLHSIPGRP